MTTFSPLLVSLVLGITAVFLAGVVAVIWWIDRYDREPIPLVIAVFGWGALVSPLVVGAVGGAMVWALTDIAGIALDAAWVPLAVAPLVEELVKAIGIVLVVWFSREFDNPTDGVVYGTAVGLGFAVTENLVYAMAAAAQSMPTFLVTGLVVKRTLFTAGVHALSSSAVGAGFGFARLANRRYKRWLWVVASIVAGVVIHGGWNGAVMNSSAPGKEAIPWLFVLPLYACFVVGLGVLLHAEQRVLKFQMAEEVALGVLPKWTVDVIPYYRKRIRSDWWPSRQERTIIARQLTRLAFRKHALTEAGASGIEGLEVVHLRQQLQRILSSSPPADDAD